MDPVVLAAGAGTRFRHTAASCPKRLYRLFGISLVERAIRVARQAVAAAQRRWDELAARGALLPVDPRRDQAVDLPQATKVRTAGEASGWRPSARICRPSMPWTRGSSSLRPACWTNWPPWPGCRCRP